MSENQKCEAPRKEEYSRPALMEYGELSRLTRGMGGTCGDSQTMPAPPTTTEPKPPGQPC